jgi:hypothetical protein
MSQQHGRISSPDATGGAGTFFEQHVNAAFLTLLLVRGIPPILTDCQLEEVHFQTEHLGWETDDVLLVGLNGAGERRRLAGQIKKSGSPGIPVVTRQMSLPRRAKPLEIFGRPLNDVLFSREFLES